jgi:hypothetical protein
VVGTASLHGDIDGRVSQIYVVIGAVIRSLHDVGAVLGENASQPVQGSGVVGKVNAQADQPSIFDQAALDDARQQGHIDIPATHDCNDLLAGLLTSRRVTNRRNAAIDYRGHGRRAGSFRQHFLSFQQQQDGVCDLLFFDGDDVVHIFLNQRKRALAARRTAIPSAMVTAEGKVTGFPSDSATFTEGIRAG